MNILDKCYTSIKELRLLSGAGMWRINLKGNTDYSGNISNMDMRVRCVGPTVFYYSSLIPPDSVDEW